MPYEITYQQIAPLIGNPITITSTTASIDIEPVIDGSTYKITVVAINTLGIRSAPVVLPNYTVVGKTLPPANVQGALVLATKYGNYISWLPNADIDLLGYEVRKGTTWALGVILQEDTTSTSFTDVNIHVGTNTYWIAAVDTSQNYSSVPVAVSVNVPAPNALSLTNTILGADYKLNWLEPNSVYAIDRYEIRIGTSWVGGALLTTTKSTSLQNPVNWAGTQNFHIAAVDIAGNYGTPSTLAITISNPVAPSITSQVVDNNVLLYWTDAKATLSIATYEIRKGVTYASAAVVGNISSLFTSLFETISGNYTYWVVGIDTAGNYGTPSSMLVTVAQPPDYILTTNFYSIFNGIFSNAAIDIDDLSMPHNLTETWTTHFTTGAHTGKPWATPQDQINAGFPIFGQPALASGFYEETVDLGTIIASNKITLLVDTLGTIGVPGVTYTISTKLNLGDAWTNYVGVTSAFATNFRYIKVKIAATSTGTDILNVRSINVRLDAKIISDSGTVQCVNTDVGGTQINFVTPFVSVTAITANYLGLTQKVDLLIDWVSIPNPVGFKILLYNSTGTRITGDVSWSAKGY